jgi:alpha-mannosidase
MAGMPLWAQQVSSAQTAPPAYFIDGYHGGIYGHIPPWQTRFMVDKLNQYPGWKINLELEPESWDTIEVKDKPAYDEFVKLFTDQSSRGRVEYINPAYGQSYLYDISGESIIRQFYYGMRKVRQHFPGAVFTTYSSEEPCFTSALPQILLSYGFRYASLKNPNTCWGGYSKAYGEELVNWVGPDGSRLVTVPRYAVEALKPKSTWETIASNNSVAYVTRSLQAGIRNPVGMCLQDAGWAFGPWIKPGKAYVPGTPGASEDVATPYMPTVFETWRGYIENHSVRTTNNDWHFSQEDVLVSLVWGGQILQQIARRVRAAENKIIATEKLAAMAGIRRAMPWPGASLDEAWRTLLLSQHHDCWIVPYNERFGVTWSDNVVKWTGNTGRRCDSLLGQAMAVLSGNGSETAVRVFNTTAADRDECVAFTLPDGWEGATVLDSRQRVVSSQLVASGDTTSEDTAARRELFRARVPSMGDATYYLRRAGRSPAQNTSMATLASAASQGSPASPAAAAAGARAFRQSDGAWQIETDLYKIVLDPAQGGVIRSLEVKQLNHHVFTDPSALRRFGELRGNFYNRGGFRSSTETPARVRILENGPLRVRVEVRGLIADNPFTQVWTLAQGQRRIDVHLDIDWTGNTGIGEAPDRVKAYPLRKAFYNDSFKLQALFPVAFAAQKIYKNAPFDVLESRLPDTFFNSWDSIKNVVLLNWVDVTDGAGKYGMALLSDHTTSYAHGPGYPLGLTLQYSGDGLFGRNYSIQGPTVLDYALIPHGGRWDKAGIWTEGTRWNEPLRTCVVAAASGAAPSTSLVRMDAGGWEVSAMTLSGQDLSVRLFNAEGDGSARKVYIGFPADSVRMVALDGRVMQTLPLLKTPSGGSYVRLSMPRFGFRTLQFIHVSNHSEK